MAFFRVDGKDEMTGAARTLYFEAEAGGQAQAFAMGWGLRDSVVTQVGRDDVPQGRLASPTPPSESGMGEAWKHSPLLLQPVRTIAYGFALGIILVSLFWLLFGVVLSALGIAIGAEG